MKKAYIMTKMNDTGVYQLANRKWAFRYTITIDGKKKDVRRTKDEFGNVLKTKTGAIRARNRAVEQEKEGKKQIQKTRKTVKVVYEEFCENGRTGRAYTTKLKQDSLWENHLKDRFGKKIVNKITVAEYRRLTSLIFRDLLKTYGTKTVKSNIMSGAVQMFQATFNRHEWKI